MAALLMVLLLQLQAGHLAGQESNQSWCFYRKYNWGKYIDFA